MDINIIEQKILSLNGGEFQKLCVALFAKKYRDYIEQTNGGAIGSNKTTKGQPDFVLKKKDSPTFILVECTTQIDNLKNKIKSDVEACIDKSGIKTELIKEIIFCYSGRKIDNSVYSKIAADLKKRDIDFNAYGIEAIALEIYNKYQCLAADFLGIQIPFSKCTFDIDEFISETEKNHLSPSLNKKFYFRESEIKAIEDSFKQNQFIILSGSAGVGKTMLALEYAKARMITDEKWIVIKAIGNPNLEEIRESTCEYDCFVVDDLSSFGKNVLDVIQILKGKNVIVTSRKYLTNDLEDELKNLEAQYKIFDIDTLSDENIKLIIKENLGINNNEYLKKIVEVAKGNPRIAFMAAEESIKNGFSALFNDKNVFANYYFDRIKSINNLKNKSENLLKVIGIVCLLKKMSIDALECNNPILTFINISKSEFKEAIKFLNDNDVISLFYDDVVTISDQCLADYLSYYVFLEKKLFNFSSVINFFFEKYPDNVVDMINMLGSMFNSKEGMEYIASEVQSSWDALKQNANVKSLKLFCAKFALMNIDNSLLFLYEHADEKEDAFLGVTNGSVNWRISTISSLLDVRTRMCCQIIEKMISSKSIDCQSITDMLVQRHGITMKSYYSKYNTQIEMLSFFIDNKGKCSLGFLKQYCLEMLKFDITYTEDKGNKFYFNTLTLRTGDGNLSQLRNKCFDVLFECGGVYDSLDAYFSCWPQKESAGIFELDLLTIETKLKEKRDRDMIRELIIYLKSKRILDDNGLRWKFMENSLEESLSLIYPVIKKSADMPDDTFKEQERRTELVLDEINASPFDVNFKRFELLNKIVKFSSLFDSDTIRFAELWFSTFSEKEIYNNIDTFLSFVNIADKFSYYNKLIVDRIIVEVGVNDAYAKIINSTSEKFKEKVITHFFKKAFDLDRTTAMALFDLYLENIKIALPKEFDIRDFLCSKIPFDKIHLFLAKYFKISEQSMKGSYESIFYLNDEDCKGMFCYLLSEDFSLLEKLYCLAFKNDKSYFDCDGDCLKQIVDKDKNFSVVVLELLFQERAPFEYVRRIKSIWKCAEYIYIGNLMFDFIRSKMSSIFFYNGTLMFGFYSAEGRKELNYEQLSWLISYLNSHKDDDSIKYLNALVRELGNETNKEYAKHLINIGVSKDLFEDFLQPAFFESYSDSYTLVINSKISFCQSLLKVIPDDISFIYHKQLVNEKIKNLRDQIQPTLKYEKINNM